jgi:SAM-dependent methyltransferase
LADLDDLDRYLAAVRDRRPPVDKSELLLDLARGRRVLDVGCIDHSAETALSLGDTWLHGRLRDTASTLVGLDVLERDAAVLNERGFDIRIGDAEAFDLGETFDLVVAADLIEHLPNSGMFLDSLRRHLAPGGRIVVTTPNPFNLDQWAGVGRRNAVAVNEQHVLWLDPVTMFQLTRRLGFSIERFEWISTRFAFPPFGRPRLARAWVRAADWAAGRRTYWRRDFAVVLRDAG